MLFDERTRTDASPRRFTESRFQFLNRSASSYFAVVRDLLEGWVDGFPAEHRNDLIGRLRKDDPAHSSAFWELYLYEGYRRTGFGVEVHPAVAGSANRPDFRIEAPDGGFYVEAVRVGEAGAKVASDHRLEAVYQVLSELKVQDFVLFVSADKVGPAPLATRRLRANLVDWVAGLDAEKVSAAVADENRVVGLRALPQVRWRDAGWDMTFSAGAVVPAGRGVDRPALGAMGFGSAGGVDNVSGIRRVLEGKHGRYGRLDLPLVIAVESDTEIPTRAYEIDRAVYGVSMLRPHDPDRAPETLVEEGFWFGRGGWQRGDTPQVITSTGIRPWAVGTCPAEVWRTLEPGRVPPAQPAWLRPMIVGAEAVPAWEPDLVRHFDLDPEWAASEPDFDLEQPR